MDVLFTCLSLQAHLHLPFLSTVVHFLNTSLSALAFLALSLLLHFILLFLAQATKTAFWLIKFDKHN